jgi:N-acyl-D-amino-acid deacylase
MYDLVIRNGYVIDGSGSPAIRADVGVIGNRIARIGRIREKGQQEIDAEGRVVTPGFVDGHTHMDAQVFWDSLGTGTCWHGITTAVMGNCGFTLAPARSDERALVVRNLERAEDISPEAMAAGIEWTWETFPQYLDAVDSLPKGINYAANIGHSALRTWIMGERAFEEAATDEDLVRMRQTLAEALQAGAIGFTTSRSGHHLTSDDRPVASRLAAWDEVVQLVSTMGELGAGLFQGPSIEDGGPSSRGGSQQDFSDRLKALAIESGVPFVFGVQPTDHGFDLLQTIEEGTSAGARMTGLCHSRGIGSMLSFETQLPFDRLKEWQGFRSLPLAEQARQMRDEPEVRRSLVEAAHHGDYGSQAVGVEARPPDYSLMYPLEHPLPPYRSVEDLALEQGVDPVDLIIDMALERDLRLFFNQPVRHYEDKKLEELMKHPHTVMTFSDAGAHVSQIADYSIQSHLLSYWVRDRQAFTLEEAVRMITFDVATVWGFADRGLLREGLMADINVFDPKTIGPRMPTVETDLPGGAKRIAQRCNGIQATVVGGQIVHFDGEHTGAYPGTLIRGPLALATR